MCQSDGLLTGLMILGVLAVTASLRDLLRPTGVRLVTAYKSEGCYGLLLAGHEAEVLDGGAAGTFAKIVELGNQDRLANSIVTKN
jgi:hypothetical protein